MAITNYTELKAAILSWMDNTGVSSDAPDFITLFEAQVNRRLLVRPQTTTTTLTPVNGVASLPSDYLEWKRVTWQGSPTRNLDYVTPAFLASVNSTGETGDPQYFTIEGNNLKVGKLSDSSIEFLYTQKVPALSDVNASNWLLASHPDGYLFGSLTMSATKTGDKTQGIVWNDLTQKFLGELWGLDFSQRGQTVQRVLGPTP